MFVATYFSSRDIFKNARVLQHGVLPEEANAYVTGSIFACGCTESRACWGRECRAPSSGECVRCACSVYNEEAYTKRYELNAVLLRRLPTNNTIWCYCEGFQQTINYIMFEMFCLQKKCEFLERTVRSVYVLEK